jgi:plasmid maintenance system killer protein
MTLQTLPTDCLGHIFSKIDKYEHIKLLIASFSDDEAKQMGEIAQVILERLDALRTAKRSKAFHTIKAEFNDMKKDNRKKNAVQKQMFIRFTAKGREVVARVDKIPISVIHATEFRDGVALRMTWTIRNASAIGDSWIADC